MKGLARVLFHVLLVALSAGIALSLPVIISFVAKNFFTYWSLIESRRIFLISAEVALAILLISFFTYVGRGWRDKRFSKMARGAGMVHFFPNRSLIAQRRIKRLKEAQGFAMDIMVISSTGFRTFADPKGDLHDVLKNCREARVMVLHPYSEGARARVRSILDPNVTIEKFSDQIKRTIAFLKELKASQKNIKLKFYEDLPFLKLGILGDYVWMKHYHPGLDVQGMPEYVFKHDQNPTGLYTPLYQYFAMRWESPDNPEYDLDADELVYRDAAGNERARKRLDGAELDVPLGPADKFFHQADTFG
jgi:hypothetical protein